MAKTRSQPASKASQESKEDIVSNKPALEPAEANPPKLLILPMNASKDARILTLPNPATAKGNRYFFCPETGLYELTTIAAPSSTPRSLLITSQQSAIEPRERETDGAAEDKAERKDEDNNEDAKFFNGYVSRSASLFVATPVDLLFLVLPILSPAASQRNGQGMFLTFEDHIEQTSEQVKRLLKPAATRTLFEKRLEAICDTVEAGDENMFRLSVEKLVGELLSKAKRMVMRGLPATMEDRFVRQALQAPVTTIKREDTTTSEVTVDEISQTETVESQDSARSTKESQESLITPATSFSSDTPLEPKTEEIPEEIKYLLRIRTSINFMLQSYLPPHLRALVQSHFATNTALDFAPLDAHLKTLASLREEARALRSLSDNISRKRPIEDDEQAEIRAEKKRKKEEEDKRKKSEGRAIKQLKKADTSGMKKMSSFFTKVAKK
ncbi:ribonuclease subunit b [Venturia nashicola]|uniref:Ribonuclease H2 subunit B n=1 Tax=Venturia nashicola TaxID=86259 RepID=A0A4Z1PPX6_9PEZI|nr:ribonuclease subunit b [Venturia nashicola]TLD37235.1 ribonuclease subunit b [Venturia nashicola]